MKVLKTDSTHKWELYEFDNKEQALEWIVASTPKDKSKILYQGRADEVTEEMAKEFVESENPKAFTWYKNYNDNPLLQGFPHLTALASFHSAHTQEWVIIIKQKI